MGGGVVVQVQLSCGGSYFVNYQMGSIFLNVLVCVQGKKKCSSAEYSREI